MAGLPGPGRFADALLDDEAVGDQFGDQIRDRDAGQSGLARKVGPAHGTLVEERLQQQRAVVTPCMLRENLRPLPQRPAGAERVAAPGSRVWGCGGSRVEELRCTSDDDMFVSRPYEQTFPQACSAEFARGVYKTVTFRDRNVVRAASNT